MALRPRLRILILQSPLKTSENRVFPFKKKKTTHTTSNPPLQLKKKKIKKIKNNNHIERHKQPKHGKFFFLIKIKFENLKEEGRHALCTKRKSDVEPEEEKEHGGGAGVGVCEGFLGGC
jgi:hypothetical protein